MEWIAKMADRKQIMSWLEGLAQDDWPMYHSESEVQEIAKVTLELLEEQDDFGKELTDAVELIHKKNARIKELKDLLKEQQTTQRTTVEVVAVTKENGGVNLFAFNESKDAINCFCYWKDKGATVTCGEVDIQ